MEVFNKEHSISVQSGSHSFWNSAKMTLALNEPSETGCSSFIFKHYHQACTTSGKNFLTLYAKQPMENHKGPTPSRKVPRSLKDNLVT